MRGVWGDIIPPWVLYLKTKEIKTVFSDVRTSYSLLATEVRTAGGQEESGYCLARGGNLQTIMSRR